MTDLVESVAASRRCERRLLLWRGGNDGSIDRDQLCIAARSGNGMGAMIVERAQLQKDNGLARVDKSKSDKSDKSDVGVSGARFRRRTPGQWLQDAGSSTALKTAMELRSHFERIWSDTIE